MIILSNGDLNVLLWNPCTRKSRTLPKLAMISDDRHYAVYGFCYDEANDDLKVFANFSGGRLDFKYKVSVYSSKSDSWRMIGNLPIREMLDCDRAVFANNAIHWVFKRSNMQLSPVRKIIVSLDITTETYREVLQPKCTQDAWIWTLGTFDKSLSILSQFRTYADLWVMKECGVEEPWTKLFTIEYPARLLDLDQSLQPVSISMNGDIILNSGSGIELYNSKDNTFKNLFHCHYRLGIVVDTYVESLISPHL